MKALSLRTTVRGRNSATGSLIRLKKHRISLWHHLDWWDTFFQEPPAWFTQCSLLEQMKSMLGTGHQFQSSLWLNVWAEICNGKVTDPVFLNRNSTGYACHDEISQSVVSYFADDLPIAQGSSLWYQHVCTTGTSFIHPIGCPNTRSVVKCTQ